MKLREFLMTTKGKVVAGAIGTVAVAGIVVAIVMSRQGFRSISVKDVEGSVNVKGEINNGPAYAGERLYGGDDVSVLEDSSLVLCMDNDKYMYADANTHFVLDADQSKDSSRIKIILDKGSELNDLKSKLKENDSYEISTPNSTMSVRGTSFRVTVHNVDGMAYTLLEVEGGVVHTRLKTADGNYTGEEKEFTAGESTLIRGNDEFSEFVNDEGGEITRHLDYDKLPEDGVERLIALLEENDETTTEEETEAEETTAETTEATSEEESETESETEATVTEDSKTTAEERTMEKATTATTATEAEKKTTEATTEKTKKTTEATTEKAKTTTEATTATNKTTTESTTSHTHSFGDWEVTKAATCTASGIEKRKCSCGETETRTIAAKGHSYGDWETTTNPTCTENGKKKRTCSVCGDVETGAIAKLGHDYSVTTSNPDIKKCSRCEATTEDSTASGNNRP